MIYTHWAHWVCERYHQNFPVLPVSKNHLSSLPMSPGLFSSLSARLSSSLFSFSQLLHSTQLVSTQLFSALHHSSRVSSSQLIPSHLSLTQLFSDFQSLRKVVLSTALYYSARLANKYFTQTTSNLSHTASFYTASFYTHTQACTCTKTLFHTASFYA